MEWTQRPFSLLEMRIRYGMIAVSTSLIFHISVAKGNNPHHESIYPKNPFPE